MKKFLLFLSQSKENNQRLHIKQEITLYSEQKNVRKKGKKWSVKLKVCEVCAKKYLCNC